MTKYLVATVCLASGLTCFPSTVYGQDAAGSGTSDELSVTHGDCSFFGPKRERFLPNTSRQTRLGDTTIKVMGLMASAAPAEGVNKATSSIPSLPGGSRSYGRPTPNTSDNLIDKEIFKVLQAKGVAPAEKTNDYEFIRRITLDLTGRIPTVARLQAFVADTDPNKRANLVDELLAKAEWVDKWTMYFGDMYKNANFQASADLQRYPQGRDGFNVWIRSSLASGKAYDQMVRELISSRVKAGNTTYNFSQGELNWIFNGLVTNVPFRQVPHDTHDQMAANTAETFLGISHVDCILCHNGRAHLDTLSLWGGNTTRSTMWGLSSFFSRTSLASPQVDPSVQNGPRYWYPEENVVVRTDYTLNTTTGNRPTRAPLPSGNTVRPVYPFSGNGPRSGETYREALAREVTADFQFARATVNYIWAEFFGRGLVNPTNGFDPDRLDPANPPPEPWTLQASHPELLNSLAQNFIDNGFNIKNLMRLIATSDAYQLSSRYDPAKWNPDWEPLFARKLVRRLWGEEITDAISQSSNIPNNFANAREAGNVPVPWSMQVSEPAQQPQFQQAFLIGNRDDQPRTTAGNIQQALAMMNENVYVMQKVAASGSGATQSLVSRALALSNDAATDLLYLTILSRNPTDAEKKSAVAYLSTGNRNQKGPELAWTLYNKVDFIFNY